MWRDVMVALEKCNREPADKSIDLSDCVLYTTAEPDMLCWVSLYSFPVIYTDADRVPFVCMGSSDWFMVCNSIKFKPSIHVGQVLETCPRK